MCCIPAFDRHGLDLFGIELEVAEAFEGRRIDHREVGLLHFGVVPAVDDVEPLGRRVVAHRVGARRGKLECSGDFVGGRVDHLRDHGVSAAIGHDKAILLRQIEDAVGRIDNALDALLHLPRLEIEDVQRAMVLRREPKAVALEVVFEMIEVACVAGQVVAACKSQHFIRGRRGDADCAKHRATNDRSDS